MPRLVRRKPLSERLKAYLNPLDFLLYVSEELETSEWDTVAFGRALGMGLNFALLLARANSGGGGGREDDVFGDGGGSNWVGWLARILTTLLTLLTLTNATYTFLRKRHYRLFETPLSLPPSTPSATLVRVSSPPTSSPLRLLSRLLPSPASRAHPDPTIDVWEIAVWDPLPLALEVYTLFSPGHAVVYWMLLPVAGGERASLTVVTALVLQGLLSVQMGVLVRGFQLKERDGRVIQKEVLNEYDTKFVHPTLHPVVRDVGTQISTSISPPPPATTSTSTGTDAAPDFDADASTISITAEEVTTHAPTTILRRGFKINPNPNYAAHISPHAPSAVPNRNSLPPSIQPFGTPKTPRTPVGQMGYQVQPPSSSAQQQQQGSEYRQPQFQQQRESTPNTKQRQPQYRASMGGRIGSEGPTGSGGEDEILRRAVARATSSGLSRVPSNSGSGDEAARDRSVRSRVSESGVRRQGEDGVRRGDGGSLGVYSHAHSPLKKASSMYDIARTREGGVRNGAQAAAREIAEERERVRRRGV
ncbi:hypothetical protein VE00_04570 [Pseudogymnoascus sp. WSF 3629]|nr:hypothetical protein VE00_04570 [Pseudogymnoascus sp. WSF 3629]